MVKKKSFIKKKLKFRQYDITSSYKKQPKSRLSEEEPIRTHITELYECTCFVSDRKLVHLFACRPEQIDILGSFEALHDNYYPDHRLLNYEFKNTFTIEDKGFYYNDGITEKQKNFLNILGLSKDEISLLDNKRIASKVISRKRK